MLFQTVCSPAVVVPHSSGSQYRQRQLSVTAHSLATYSAVHCPSLQVRASLERQLLAPAPIREWTGVPAVAVDIPGNPLARAHTGSASPRHEYPSPEFAATERGSPLTPGPYEARRDHRGFVLDPTIPDVTSSVYMSDEFRMFSFKVRTTIRFCSNDSQGC